MAASVGLHTVTTPYANGSTRRFLKKLFATRHITGISHTCSCCVTCIITSQLQTDISITITITGFTKNRKSGESKGSLVPFLLVFVFVLVVVLLQWRDSPHLALSSPAVCRQMFPSLANLLQPLAFTSNKKPLIMFSFHIMVFQQVYSMKF